MDAALARHQLTTPQYAALSAMNTDVRLSNADLARQSFVTPQTMKQNLRSLRTSGFVTRKADPNHGRRRLYLLTPAGEHVLDKTDEIVNIIDQ